MELSVLVGDRPVAPVSLTCSSTSLQIAPGGLTLNLSYAASSSIQPPSSYFLFRRRYYQTTGQSPLVLCVDSIRLHIFFNTLLISCTLHMQPPAGLSRQFKGLKHFHLQYCWWNVLPDFSTLCLSKSKLQPFVTIRCTGSDSFSVHCTHMFPLFLCIHVEILFVACHSTCSFIAFCSTLGGKI